MKAALMAKNAPASVSYVVLDQNRSLESQLFSPNTVFEVRTHFNLSGKRISIPEHCILFFNGGSFSNGILSADDGCYSVSPGSKGLSNCRLEGHWRQTGPVARVSSFGIKSNSGVHAKVNYRLIDQLIRSGYSLFFDGSYYVDFGRPIVLDRVLDIFGGEILFSKVAFSFSNGGGLRANGTSFTRMEGATQSYLCGSGEKYKDIMIECLEFDNCTFDCHYIARVSFRDMNSDKVRFGIRKVRLNHCRMRGYSRLYLLNAVIHDECIIQNSVFAELNTVPIYICHSHSKQSNPEEDDAYEYAGINIANTCPISVLDNVFIGKPISSNFYYCSVLLRNNICFFKGNYIQDFINYTGREDHKSATAYDAYLSCVEVYYSDNFIRDVYSYSLIGRNKPQCEIGKSKSNPLLSAGKHSVREYKNNKFVIDATRISNRNVDKSSLYVNIFGNVTHIDDYIWNDNIVITKGVSLNTGTSSAGYGSFVMNRNLFDVEEFVGNGLLSFRSDENMSIISMMENVFRSEKRTLITLLNQKYYKNYYKYQHDSITVKSNRFENTSPIFYIFAARKFTVIENIFDKCNVNKTYYLNNYSGAKTPLVISDMDVSLNYSSIDSHKGALVQCFSSSSNGVYSCNVSDIPVKGIKYNYYVDGDDSFSIQLQSSSFAPISISFRIEGNNVHYNQNGNKGVLSLGNNSKTLVWYNGNIKFETSFSSSDKKALITKVTRTGQSNKKASYSLVFNSF